ncbi:MAG TPA: TetR family transcriptional regulator [Acidimicrobiales bacterium]
MGGGNGRDTTDDSRRAPRGRTNARGDATRELILLTAERLFAERGIEAVPLRDIGVAAGQKNNVAVQYHFGDRESLVTAIAAYRADFMSDHLNEVVADLASEAGPPTVEQVVRSFVRGLSRNLDEDNHFLPFISRYIIERGGYEGLDSTVPSSSIATMRIIMLRLLPHLNDALLYERWQVLMTSAVHTLARYQVAMRLQTLPGPLDDLVEDLVHFLAAGLASPVRSSDSRVRSSGRRPKSPTTP